MKIYATSAPNAPQPSEIITCHLDLLIVWKVLKTGCFPNAGRKRHSHSLALAASNQRGQPRFFFLPY